MKTKDRLNWVALDFQIWTVGVYKLFFLLEQLEPEFKKQIKAVWINLVELKDTEITKLKLLNISWKLEAILFDKSESVLDEQYKIWNGSMVSRDTNSEYFSSQTLKCVFKYFHWQNNATIFFLLFTVYKFFSQHFGITWTIFTCRWSKFVFEWIISAQSPT